MIAMSRPTSRGPAAGSALLIHFRHGAWGVYLTLRDGRPHYLGRARSERDARRRLRRVPQFRYVSQLLDLSHARN